MKLQTVRKIASKKGLEMQANTNCITLLTESRTIQLNLTAKGNVHATILGIEQLCDNLIEGKTGIQRRRELSF